MKENFLRNREGKNKARIVGHTLRDGTGKIVAVYHATEDLTRDKAGRIVGKGDQRWRALGESGDN